LTNVHVVDNAERLLVVLRDNREFEARVVGLDPLTEVAVIKIDARDLPVAKLGDSGRIRVGDWVLAIGNPLDLRSTVTAGIISAKERRIDIIRDNYSVESFIQTDAAINPGNSGGALVNLYAEVIGVNTAIATESGYNAGFGFAIPINLARKIMTDIIEKGRVERAHLGVAMKNVNEKLAKALGLGRPQGVFIDDVQMDSPAQRNGVMTKDVILSIDGAMVTRTNQVQALIAARSPGDSIVLQIWRDGRRLDVRVRLTQRDDSPLLATQRPDDTEFQNLGIEVEDLQENTAAVLGYTGKLGVLVTQVTKWSPADDSRIQQDDVIIEINDRKINNTDDFHAVMAELGPGSVSIFTISRHNEKYHLFVENPIR
jgi:serine protease Do